jgi:hypothetical protein
MYICIDLWYITIHSTVQSSIFLFVDISSATHPHCETCKILINLIKANLIFPYAATLSLSDASNGSCFKVKFKSAAFVNREMCIIIYSDAVEIKTVCGIDLEVKEVLKVYLLAKICIYVPKYL